MVVSVLLFQTPHGRVDELRNTKEDSRKSRNGMGPEKCWRIFLSLLRGEKCYAIFGQRRGFPFWGRDSQKVIIITAWAVIFPLKIHKHSSSMVHRRVLFFLLFAHLGSLAFLKLFTRSSVNKSGELASCGTCDMELEGGERKLLVRVHIERARRWFST